MNTPMYHPMTAEDQLAYAQHVLDTHVTSSATGRCRACGTPGPLLPPGNRRSDLFADAAASAPPTRRYPARTNRRSTRVVRYRGRSPVRMLGRGGHPSPHCARPRASPTRRTSTGRTFVPLLRGRIDPDRHSVHAVGAAVWG
jgi:hypothetical protein